ncbi:unnamed protein product, partial [Timema podura]|nr:unnamed protein product [Timema podura]
PINVRKLNKLRVTGHAELFVGVKALSAAVSKEANPSALDNICGALARMLITNVSGVPMDHVFPVFVNYLPLRQDFDENKAVFRCLLHLYQMGHPMLQKLLSPLVRAGLVVINGQQGDK